MAQPMTSSEFLSLSTATLERQVKPAEVAQARIFEGMLQAEVLELHQLAHRLAASFDRQAGHNGNAPSRDLLRIRTRIDEVQRLLHALRGRFPHACWDSELQPD